MPGIDSDREWMLKIRVSRPLNPNFQCPIFTFQN